MDSIASFHKATGGHYITMLPADWANPHHMTLFPSSFYDERCYRIRLYLTSETGRAGETSHTCDASLIPRPIMLPKNEKQGRPGNEANVMQWLTGQRPPSVR